MSSFCPRESWYIYLTSMCSRIIEPIQNTGKIHTICKYLRLTDSQLGGGICICVNKGWVSECCRGGRSRKGSCRRGAAGWRVGAGLR